MKKIYICAIVLASGLIIGLPMLGNAETTAHKLSDYGLTEESVKYLSPQEIQDILKSPTPAETLTTAKENAAKNPSTAPSSTIPGVLPNTVNCFNYYHFGSIQADIWSGSSNAVPGMDMQFAGTIKNSNNYPIVGGTLYVKIMKQRGVTKDPNGPDVVDQFIAMDNVSIPANQSVAASFSWKIPLYAESGDYRVATYFVTNKKFNLSGLSFTDDVTGNTFNFSINGDNSTIVGFDKAGVTINNNPYFFAAYPPSIADKDSANVSAKIDNTTSKDMTVNVTWNLYHWDAMDSANLVRTANTPTAVLVKAHSSAKVSINIPDKAFPVYYLVGELSYKDTKSVLNIRFTRAGVDLLRLNFPSITQFPLESGVPVSMFSCVHNSGTSAVVPGSKVVLKLTDGSGVVIDQYTYDGPVTGEMMAVKKDVTPDRTINNATLHAEVWQNGKIVDQADVAYDCNTIDATKCGSPIPWSGYALIGLILVIIVLIIIIVLVHRHAEKIHAKLLLLVILLIPLGLLLNPSTTHAKSVSWNKQDNNELVYFWNRWLNGTGASGWVKGLTDRNVTINYNVEIRNAVNGALINDGDSVSVGTNLSLHFIPHQNVDVYWFGTGYSSDSPYGEWRTDAAPPSTVKCETKDFVSKDTFGHDLIGDFDVYVPLVVDLPDKTISNTNNMSCSALTGDETNGYSMQCTVNTSGMLNPKFNFGPTVGNFFYRYYDFRPASPATLNTPPGCYGNNIPMELALDQTQNQWALLFQWFFGYFGKMAPYQLSVPQQSIQYNLTATPAVDANQPPTPPVITGAATGTVGIAYTFNLVSTDPDNDTIKYGIDWSEPSDGVVDQWLPTPRAWSTGYVDSGTSLSASKSWATIGTHKFKAMAVDVNGATSTWVKHVIDLAPVIPSNQPPTPPVITGAVTGSINTAYTFSLVSTDPDNNQIKYGIDWSEPSDGVIDQWLPSQGAWKIGYVDSGVPLSTSQSWPTLGLHKFKAVTVDSFGAMSTWVKHTITLATSTNGGGDNPGGCTGGNCGGCTGPNCGGNPINGGDLPETGPLELSIGLSPSATSSSLQIPIGTSFNLYWVLPAEYGIRTCRVADNSTPASWVNVWQSYIDDTNGAKNGDSLNNLSTISDPIGIYNLVMTCSSSTDPSIPATTDSVKLRLTSSNVHEI